MDEQVSKKRLGIILSKLKSVENPKITLEQYTTDSEVASTVLWKALVNGDIESKLIADFGCGNGILGIGALLLGAKKVFFIDKDKDSIKVLKENLELFSDFDFEIIESDIKNINIKVDTVIQNPPFGTRTKHADKEFLIKAFNSADNIYSFHKTSTKRFVEAISKDFRFKIVEELEFNFPLKQEYVHHKKNIQRIKVSCFHIVKA